MRDILLVVNRSAAGGRAAAVWERLQRHRPDLAESPTVAATDAAGTAAGLTAALAHRPRRVIVVGGDGTVNLVANVLLESGAAAEAALGLVPAGTGSDLARTLGLPRSPEATLARALAIRPRPLDAILLATDDGRRRWVVNVASAGLSGVVDEAVNAVPNRGATTFMCATVGALWSYRPRRARVVVDGELLHEGPLFLLAVANGRSFGRGMRVAPRAVVDDGWAEVVLVTPVPRWQLPARLCQLLAGAHLDAPFVRYRRGRSIRLEPLEELPPFDVDGEVMPSCAAELSLWPGALKVLA